MYKPVMRLHPVCKLILILALMAMGFSCWETGRLMLLCVTVLMLLLADPGKQLYLRVLRMTMLSGAVFGLTWLIGNSVQTAFGAALHLELLLLLSLFMLRTPVSELLRGLQSCHVPDELLLGFLIVFRFVDVLREELQSIRLAGSMLPKGSLSGPLKFYRCLVIPFVYRLFVLSDQLSISVTSRDFGTNVRSEYRSNPLRVRDVLMLASVLVISGGIIWMR